MQATTAPRSEPAALPEDLTTAEAKLVYLALETTAARTVDDLQERLDLGKLTLFQLLSTMTDAGLVERDDRGRYATC